jgi:thiamine transport system substrate-binding protein
VTEVTVLTHDSFAVSPEVLAKFEAQYHAKVVIVNAGDAGSMLNKAILSKDAPLADVIYGVDNTFLSRALTSGILADFTPVRRLNGLQKRPSMRVHHCNPLM